MKGVILAKALLLFSFEVFSLDCDAGFWDSVPCVMKNNDFVFFFFTDMPVSVPHL